MREPAKLVLVGKRGKLEIHQVQYRWVIIARVKKNADS